LIIVLGDIIKEKGLGSFAGWFRGDINSKIEIDLLV
jgi:hypothetical protein